MNATGKALFLDRDGTLIVKHDYLSNPAGVALLPGVREVLHRFVATGYRLFLFTNQSGVGRGMFSLDKVHRCNDRMLELLALPAPGFTEVCIATEAPDMPVVYRKPSPRFIREMVGKYSLNCAATWMVGDMPSDIQAGLSAGVRTAWISSERVSTIPDGVWPGRDFAEFAAMVFAEESALTPGGNMLVGAPASEGGNPADTAVRGEGNVHPPLAHEVHLHHGPIKPRKSRPTVANLRSRTLGALTDD